MSDPAGRRGAEELGCDWHTVSKEVNRWGEALLEADRDRVGEVEALGLDETLFLRQGPRRQRMWVTSAVDIRNSRLIDVFPGKTAKDAARWLLGQPAPVAGNIGWATDSSPDEEFLGPRVNARLGWQTTYDKSDGTLYSGIGEAGTVDGNSDALLLTVYQITR